MKFIEYNVGITRNVKFRIQQSAIKQYEMRKWFLKHLTMTMVYEMNKNSAVSTDETRSSWFAKINAWQYLILNTLQKNNGLYGAI